MGIPQQYLGSQPPGCILTLMRVSYREVFLAFLYVGLTAFGGGGLAHLYATLVQRKGWLSNNEFLEAVALCQLVPGPAFAVLGTHLGARLGGTLGGFLALAGLTLPGISLMVVLTLLYFGGGSGVNPTFSGVLSGVAASAVGLVLASFLRQAPPVLRQTRNLTLTLGVFLAYGVLHWPLLLVLVVGIPAGLLLFWSSPDA